MPKEFSLRVRRATADDVSRIMDLERGSARAAHWSRQQYESLFATSGPQSAERVILIAGDETAGVGSEIFGFLFARRVGVEWELENIVVANDMRRGGTGRLLLTELITLARAAGGCAIFLEVRESNQDARAFYRRMGFDEACVRKLYYASPAENAVLCRLRLI
jgi:ribosomal protein S18 acetylase RimI-like enzyme